MAYSTHKGCTSNNCKFEHLCPVILENGKICLQKHPAFQHAQKAGEEGLVPVALPADATGDAFSWTSTGGPGALFQQHFWELAVILSRHVKERFEPPFANQDGAGIYSVEAFADARADGELIGIGGFIAFPSGAYIWFSQAWQLSDLSVLGLELRRPAHKDIACYETLAQIALVHAYRSVFPSGRVAVRLPSFSDNASTEALGAKLYTAKWPLGAFAQKLSLISAASGIELDISHIAGEKNDDADMLSRWNQTDSLPDKWRKEDRVDCSLKFIWFFRKEVLVWPSHFSLPAVTQERHVSDDDI
ncbi:unnamed protein product [Symbiodinium sp. CCMP2592]|nr:unnamed protein product [Symbiodinium sp. CCMP2592]